MLKMLLILVHSSVQMLTAAKIPRRLWFVTAAMEELGKLAESEDVSFETKIRIIHASVFPATMY